MQFQLPVGFPADVEAAAEAAARRSPTGYVDRSALPFVTLDPPSSTDLDQAFVIQTSGSDLLLLYAIADVGCSLTTAMRSTSKRGAAARQSTSPTARSAFIRGAERRRGQPAARRRPPGDPVYRAGRSGRRVGLDGVERALIRSRAKLGYATVTPGPAAQGFAELSRRIAPPRRRAARLGSTRPQQEVVRDADGQLRPAPSVR